jgi:conjugal transfer pilin signal peptidase TrbI
MPRGARWLLLGLCGGLAFALAELAAWRDKHALLINASTSLPNWAFAVDRSRTPRRGDIVFFEPRWSPLLVAHFGAHPPPFGKLVLGMPGDRVTVLDRVFRINGRPVGQAKLRSRQGAALALGPAGTIPPGCYFVGTPHPDSFDSRYAAIGWVCRRQVLGVGRAIL